MEIKGLNQERKPHGPSFVQWWRHLPLNKKSAGQDCFQRPFTSPSAGQAHPLILNDSIGREVIASQILQQDEE